MDDKKIRRLVIWNRIWLVLLVLALVSFAGSAWLGSTFSRARALSATWLPSGEVRLSSASDGPFVVTHLVKYGHDEGEKAVARLPQPIAIVDSAGATIEKDVIAKLAWVNIFGEPVPAPNVGSNIEVLYYRPEVTNRRQ